MAGAGSGKGSGIPNKANGDRTSDFKSPGQEEQDTGRIEFVGNPVHPVDPVVVVCGMVVIKK